MLLVKFELAQIVVLIICHVRSYFLKSLNKYEGGGRREEGGGRGGGGG